MQQGSRGSGWGRDESHLYSSWSAWEWNEQYQCESRYRQDWNGEWKWEYRQVILEEESAPKPDVVQQSSRQDQYGGPSSLEPWSPWRWSETYQCQERHRKNRNGQWEWNYSNVALEDGENAPGYSAAVTVVQESSQQDEYSAPSFPEPNDSFDNDPNANLLSDSTDVSASFGNLQISEQSSSDRYHSPRIICTWPSCSETFIRISDRDRHYQTIHANNGDRPYKCLVKDCTAGVKSWANAEKLKSHNKNWHGPYHCLVNGCSRAFPCGLRSKQDLDNHTLEVHSTNMLFSSADADSMFGKGKEPENYSYSSPAPTFSSAVPRSNASYTPLQSLIPSNEPQQLKTRISTSTVEKSDKRFKVHRSKDFSFGRVFKVLWSEPTGSGGTEITERGGGGKNGAFQKQRRFVIVDSRKGHCICLPILTYGGQGTLKYGVHPEDHAPIYSSKREGPCLLEGERPGKEAIRVEIIDLSQKLDPMSRLNYAKLYTVEHNVKVFFIGKIAKSSEQKVVDAYNDVHLPLPARPELVAEMTDENFKHAEGPEPSYPKQDSYSSAWNWNPWPWSSSTARNPNQSSHDPPSAQDPEYNTETPQDGENIYDAEE